MIACGKSDGNRQRDAAGLLEKRRARFIRDPAGPVGGNEAAPLLKRFSRTLGARLQGCCEFCDFLHLGSIGGTQHQRHQDQVVAQRTETDQRLQPIPERRPIRHPALVDRRLETLTVRKAANGERRRQPYQEFTGKALRN